MAPTSSSESGADRSTPPISAPMWTERGVTFIMSDSARKLDYLESRGSGRRAAAGPATPATAPHDPGPWPEGFTASREQIHDDMGRLTGGPETTIGNDHRPACSSRCT